MTMAPMAGNDLQIKFKQPRAYVELVVTAVCLVPKFLRSRSTCFELGSIVATKAILTETLGF